MATEKTALSRVALMRRAATDSVRTLEFRHLGLTLLRSVLVGVAVGVVACIFFYALEWADYLFLGRVGGYVALRPAGEHPFAPVVPEGTHLRPVVLIFVPAIGALLAGVVSHFFALETREGGGDAFIFAFHQNKGEIRKRVGPLKLLVSVLTLGSGGSGGREGPTMQIGAAVGALVGRLLRLTARERRLLLVAGVAGGMAAIFRTPLGAALFAVEALYRDDFESDALIPAILASVSSYSIFVTVFPDTGHLFAHAADYPFHPKQLPLYILMAVLLSLGAQLFVGILRTVRKRFADAHAPEWLKPAIGGLILGVIAVSWITLINPNLSLEHRGAGILGSGYGAAQGAITGAPWIRRGWLGVEFLAALALVKMVATSFTIGSGGSAGDFGPSLVIGGLLGGAFGRAAQLLLDPTLDPGAFALVGMGTFYGGLAHVPVSSAVMVCEMAGSYDLLVPLMLAEGVAFVALRRTGLYQSQMQSRFDSPAHANEASMDVLKTVRAGDKVTRNRRFATLSPRSTIRDVMTTMAHASAWQDVFPVLDGQEKLVGILSADVIRPFVHDDSIDKLVLVADIMGPPITIGTDDDLHEALEALLETGMRELPVIDEHGGIVGLLDESDITKSYHDHVERHASEHASRPASSTAPE